VTSNQVNNLGERFFAHEAVKIGNSIV